MMGLSRLKCLPPLLCPQGSLRTRAGPQGLGSAPGRAWSPGRWRLDCVTTGEPGG